MSVSSFVPASYGLLGPFGRAKRAFSTAVQRLAAFGRSIKHRRDARILAAFDDRMLADIGVSRSDLRDAFSSPLWEDPTELLDTRARERRVNRRQAPRPMQASELHAPPLAPDQAFRRPPIARPARFTV